MSAELMATIIGTVLAVITLGVTIYLTNRSTQKMLKGHDDILSGHDKILSGQVPKREYRRLEHFSKLSGLGLATVYKMRNRCPECLEAWEPLIKEKEKEKKKLYKLRR